MDRAEPSAGHRARKGSGSPASPRLCPRAGTGCQPGPAHTCEPGHPGGQGQGPGSVAFSFKLAADFHSARGTRAVCFLRYHSKNNHWEQSVLPMSKLPDVIQPMKVTFILQQIKKFHPGKKRARRGARKCQPGHSPRCDGTGRLGVASTADLLHFASQSRGSEINRSIISSYENKTPQAPLEMSHPSCRRGCSGAGGAQVPKGC